MNHVISPYVALLGLGFVFYFLCLSANIKRRKSLKKYLKLNDHQRRTVIRELEGFVRIQRNAVEQIQSQNVEFTQVNAERLIKKHRDTIESYRVLIRFNQDLLRSGDFTALGNAGRPDTIARL